MAFCNSCGNNIGVQAFCSNCGKAVAGNDAAAQPGSTTVPALETQKKSSSALKPILISLGFVAVAGVGLAFFLGMSGANRLSDAVETCGAEDTFGVDLLDNGATLVIDTEGEEDWAGASYMDVVCILSALSTPDRIISRIEGTSSLDGQVTDSADGLTYYWKYHPDSGVQMTISRD